MFEDMLRVNETLIDFEFGFNNFSLVDVSALSDEVRLWLTRFFYVDPEDLRPFAEKQS